MYHQNDTTHSHVQSRFAPSFFWGGATDNSPGFLPDVRTWADFAAMLTSEGHNAIPVEPGPEAERAAKLRCPMFSPAEFREGKTRREADALRVHFGVLDLDHVDRSVFDTFLECLRDAGREALVYTSWSHGLEEGKVSARLCVPFTRPVEAREWSAFWPRMHDHLGALGDVACRDIARAYFLPFVPESRAELAEVVHLPGAPLDVDALLQAGAIASTTLDVAKATSTMLSGAKSPASARIGEGERNEKLFRLACSLRGRGLGPEEINGALQARNANECDPPLDPSEVQRIAWSAARYEPRAPFHHTDTGNAERLVHEHGARFRYVSQWGKWLAWDGQRWALDGAEALVHQAAKETIRGMYDDAATLEDDDRRKSLATHARACEARSRRDAMVALARTEPGVGVGHEALDADPWLLNVLNGTIDLRTGELRPHDAADMLTKIAPVAYDPAATCPSWERFVHEVLAGDTETIEYVQRAVGYTLTGETREHCLFFLHGGGANGKSTFVGTLFAMLGDYAKACPPDLLLTTRGGEHPTAIANLLGARLATCQEPEENRSWNDARLKELTGGDRIAARRMREDFWDFTPTHKFWISSNPEPVVRGTDDGIWRRLRKVPFTVSFKGREDRTLPERLRAELPGILAWAVRGCLAWQRSGLGESSTVRTATERYRAEQDTFGQFIAERCTIGTEHRITRQELRVTYEEWCRGAGETPLKAKGFTSRVRTVPGVVEGKVWRPGATSPGDGWHGITLQGRNADRPLAGVN